jgi:hypothetical protein
MATSSQQSKEKKKAIAIVAVLFERKKILKK